MLTILLWSISIQHDYFTIDHGLGLICLTSDKRSLKVLAQWLGCTCKSTANLWDGPMGNSGWAVVVSAGTETRAVGKQCRLCRPAVSVSTVPGEAILN